MSDFQDPLISAAKGFKQGWRDGAIEREPKKLQPWAKGVLYFCGATAAAAGVLTALVQFGILK